MKMKLWITAIAAIVIFASCAPTQAGEVVQSEKQRITSPNVNQADQAALVDGNNAFALDTYQVIRKAEGNLFFSPYSISLALAMTYAGARGTTAQQMANTLHFTLPQEQLHPAFNSLDTELSQRGQGAKGKDEKGFRLNIVNAIWGQKGYKFLPEFLDTLAQNYGAGLRTLDFKQASEASRITINDWVSQQTEGRIKDLIPKGAIDPLTRLVLTNAIYFNAAWQFPFKKESTKDGAFHLLDGREVTVPMMRQTEWLGYAEGANYQAVELPYDGRQLSMVILLPRTGQFAEFEKSLDANQLKAITRDISSERIALTMPRYEFTSEFSLAKTLTDMGMPDAFTGRADFSGMTGRPDLLISDVFHKAFVAVDEEGTEAAAATAVIMALKAAPGAPIEVTVDRPFIFLIRDIKTGTLLFIGRVLNPST
ncbi:MAG: serpin family protein [Chloroflexi bacterium]|nr:serpin family protein [Chloroflexota bacterium]MBM3173363.1 serpin family protein [Chloroflexota bacterium]MBM4451028.1 serpin family protein [Chloroflexota bacterium]